MPTSNMLKAECGAQDDRSWNSSFIMPPKYFGDPPKTQPSYHTLTILHTRKGINTILKSSCRREHVACPVRSLGINVGKLEPREHSHANPPSLNTRKPSFVVNLFSAQ
jgi:hypothetical protein